MGELREAIIAEGRLRGYSSGTQHVYASCVVRFLEHAGQEPTVVAASHVRDYLLHLEDLGLAASTRKTHVAAIRFLFNNVLFRPEVAVAVLSPKARTPLPEILSHSEVMRVLDALTSIRCRVASTTIYGTGLRVSEVVRLRAADVDSDRKLIRVRAGKGGRDRYVPLSPNLLHTLRAYWVVLRPHEQVLFPSHNDLRKRLHPRVLRAALHRAATAAGLTKPVGPHVLRHTFATHMLELGVDVRRIQVVLGHRSITTTTRYTQVSTRHIAMMKSPLDVSAEEAALLG